MPQTHSDSDISLRIAHGTLGFYTHIEITEIFVVRDDDRVARNVFTLLVAEEQFGTPASTSAYLGERIRLKSIDGMMFGIKRSTRPISMLMQAVQHYRESNVWQVSDRPLHVGALMPVPPQFVPADSTEGAPLNKVLKNNFWSGSHILEMMDVNKSALAFLFERPARLQEFSATVTKILPISLAGLSDRLGNIVVQLPVTILIASFMQNRRTGNGTITVRWHPQASPRQLIATCEKVYDNIVTGYAATIINSTEVTLSVDDGLGMQRGVLWDDTNNLMLAATEPTAFINQIAMQTHLSDPEPRVFTLVTRDGEAKEIRVGLTGVSDNIVQAPRTDRGEEWTRRRVYREEANRLSLQRRFVQYRPKPGQQQASHENALNDIVQLLSQHGKGGAWLWDPYLSADDLMRTLFRCPFVNAPLRALTAAYERPNTSRPKPTLRSIFRQIVEWLQNHIRRPLPSLSFAERQRRALSTCQSNYRGLNIEYRMKVGQAGWAFHDRFLIFPNTKDGPLAWSLGSSVNSLGRQHHILQQVDDARLVADAFEELWDELSQPDHVIWKIP